MTLEERIGKLEEHIIKQDERIDALEQEKDACHKALGKLTTTCQMVIEKMQPALAELSIRGIALRAWDEKEPPLTKEEVGELYIRYSRAARTVEDAYVSAIHIVQGYPLR